MSETTVLTGAMRVSPPTLTLPDGMITLPAVTARMTSSGDIPYARNRSGLTRITIVR